MAPPPPPELIDDVISEILLRLPPDEPEHLFRAALVCKPCLRIVRDAAFLRLYRAFHGAPPLLGLLEDGREVFPGDPHPPARFFTCTTSMPLPDFPHAGSGCQSDGRCTRPLDSRHGRVLLLHIVDEGSADADEVVDYLVWDPITGERHAVPEPPPDIDWSIYTAAVLCATHGCDHLDCHGGPFRVVFLATDKSDELVKASVYSSVTGAWSAPVSLDDRCEFYAQHMRDAKAELSEYIPCVQRRRFAAIGDEIYFTLYLAQISAIAKYDCARNCLCVVDPPPPHRQVYDGAMIALMVMDDNNSLGLAAIGGSSLHLWSRKVDDDRAAEWVQRVIDLDKTMPMAGPCYGHGAYVVGSAENLGVIFIKTYDGLFTFQLKSGLVKKVGEPADRVHYSVLPYMAFYTPDMALLPCP